LYQAKANIGL